MPAWANDGIMAGACDATCVYMNMHRTEGSAECVLSWPGWIAKRAAQFTAVPLLYGRFLLDLVVSPN